MASRTAHSFSGVSVGLPSKVRGSEAEDKWQEVEWVTWSSGDLSVDTGSFLLIFNPSGSEVTAKPLGNLVRASTVGDDSQCELVISSTDAVHPSLRLTFVNALDAREFQNLADAVEAAHVAAVARGNQACTRSSSGSMGSGSTQLATAIQEKYAGRWPLIFGGAGLYGPSLSGEGSEVLLGRGVMVLLDPEEDATRVGRYELQFFGEDEGAAKPVHTFPIGPSMSLKQQPVDVEDEDGPAVMFGLCPGKDLPVFQCSFDDAAAAHTFNRDFHVRCRLMDLSLKTVKGKQAANEARSELKELHRKSLGARLWRLIFFILTLVVVATCLRAAQIYSEPAKRHAEKAAKASATLQKDFSNAAHISYKFAASASSKACELVGGAVSTAALQKCLSVGGVSQVRECVEMLLD